MDIKWVEEIKAVHSNSIHRTAEGCSCCEKHIPRLLTALEGAVGALKKVSRNTEKVYPPLYVNQVLVSLNSIATKALQTIKEGGA